MSTDLHSLPKFRDGLSYLYVERCAVEKEDQAIAFFDETGKTQVPCAALALLMLGPGTNITHAAVKVLADAGTTVLWTGEGGTRLYACGTGETRSSVALQRQALLASHPQARLAVVRRLYTMRFAEAPPADASLQQIRGMEGARVRRAYGEWSQRTGVPWHGRHWEAGNWNKADAVNKALSTANACLYGICHAAILSMGYSPGLGFIHTGKQLSFVYDLADLYKTETSIPAAFETARELSGNVGKTVRMKMRSLFEQLQLLKRISEDLPRILDLSAEEAGLMEQIDALNAAVPGGLWDPDGVVSGGVNYAGEVDDGDPDS